MATTNQANAAGEIIEPAMDIDLILGTLGEGGEVEEIVAAEPDSMNELELEAAVSAAERYEETGETEATAEPEVEAAAEPEKKKKGGKKKDAAAPAAPAEEKKRIYFSKQSDRIAHRLGEKLGEFMLLEIGDAALTGEELQARNKEVLAAIDGTAKKVGEKAAMLFKWMQQGGDLNEVMKRAFTLMKKDGYLTSGDKGNLQEYLLAKPYSLGTARSQSNQVFCLFRALKIANMDGKGKMVPNDQSIILMKANSTLGL